MIAGEIQQHCNADAYAIADRVDRRLRCEVTSLLADSSMALVFNDAVYRPLYWLLFSQ